MSPGSSRRAGGFSLVLRPTTTGGSFWEFDCFTVQKRSSFGTQSSPRRTFLAGRRSGRLEGRFPPARLLLPGGSQDNWLLFNLVGCVESHKKLSLPLEVPIPFSADGNFYGTTSAGGANDSCVLVWMSP